MGYSYLNNKYWNEISREERLYCAHLYWKEDVNKFIKWINLKLNKQYDSNENWEVSVEVCFYRDYHKMILKKSINESEYSNKRTFDICLFSEKKIILFEAKAQGPFGQNQLSQFILDRVRACALLNNSVTIDLIVIASSKYFENFSKFGRAEGFDKIDGKITWESLCEIYNDPMLMQANQCYKN